MADAGWVRELLEEVPGVVEIEATPPTVPWRQRLPRVALNRAVKLHEVEIAEMLIEAGADPNRRDEQGRAALHYVRTPDMVTRLVAAGADPRGLTEDGKSALARVWNVDSRLGRATAEALIAAGTPVTFEDTIAMGDLKRASKLVPKELGENSTELH